MNIRWLWLDHIPPELELSGEQKKSVRARASQHRKREPNYRGAGRRYALMFFPMFLIVFGCYYFWLHHVISARRTGMYSPIFINAVFFAIIYGPMAYALHRTRAPFVLHAVRDIGYEICEDCGYWLRGLSDDVKHCPECGAQREPMQRPAQE